MDYSVLGRPTIMELNFPSLPDEEIKVGQLIILWEEIPVRKIGPNIYEVYAEASVPVADFFDEPIEKRAQRFLDWAENQKQSVIPPFLEETLETKKYIRTSKGSKRVRPWESPRFFG